jgi:hypothetical protein
MFALFFIVANNVNAVILIFTLVTIIGITIGAFFHKSFIKKTYGKSAIRIFKIIDIKSKQNNKICSSSTGHTLTDDNKGIFNSSYNYNIPNNIYNSDR